MNSEDVPRCNKPALKSRATPMCDMASARLGVNPISNTSSVSISNTLAAGVPGTNAASRIIIPSWLSPNPSSSSAQIIPWLSCPRIFPFLISNAFPSLSNNLVPIVATGTFCPTATLGAPHTICTGALPSPKSTVVIFNLSASGCFSQVSTWPTTTPCNPPFKLSKVSTPSTSKPKSVSMSAISSDFKSVLMNCFNQLYDIRIFVSILKSKDTFKN